MLVSNANSHLRLERMEKSNHATCNLSSTPLDVNNTFYLISDCSIRVKCYSYSCISVGATSDAINEFFMVKFFKNMEN